MKCVLRAFMQFLKEIWHDIMLAVILFAPILIGVVFRFVLPTLEIALCEHFGLTEILSPYYLLFDLLLCIMTPMMFAFAGVMVMLGEIDNGISRYMVVTPLRKSGYLFSRIGIPSLLAAVYNIVLLLVFSLTDISLVMMISLSVLSGISGIITSLLVVSFASNKVEGMAMTKLSGLIMLGLPAVFFVAEPMQYIAGILPSFWLAKFALTQETIFVIPAALVSMLWLALFYHKFIRKIM